MTDTDEKNKMPNRRDALKGTAALMGLIAAAGMLARPTPASAKISKRAAGYVASPRNGQKCANCRWFYPRSRTCKVVSGTFSPNGWCRLWRR